jgi:hypothetical protein
MIDGFTNQIILRLHAIGISDCSRGLMQFSTALLTE